VATVLIPENGDGTEQHRQVMKQQLQVCERQFHVLKRQTQVVEHRSGPFPVEFNSYVLGVVLNISFRS